MIIKFKNLGPMEHGEIDFSDLKGINLIIGKNNTGKTYLSNLIYSYFEALNKVVKNLSHYNLYDVSNFKFLKKIRFYEDAIDYEIDYEILKKNCEEYIISKINKILPSIFHTKQIFFENFEIKKLNLNLKLKNKIESLKSKNILERVYLTLENKSFLEIVKEKDSDTVQAYIRDTKDDTDLFYEWDYYLERDSERYSIISVLRKIFDKFNNIRFFPAERSGAILFYRQLLQERSDRLRKIEMDPEIEIKNINQISRYSEPVNDYIKFLNSIPDYAKGLDETEIYRKVNSELKEILGGEVIIDSDENIAFKMENGNILDMGLVSSTVKTLAGFFLYLKYQAKENDIISIDEIELNLHPENQRKVIKLINYLSKQGLKFIISTHSPIITQEINNMVMFEKSKYKINEEILKEFDINKEYYGLAEEDVNTYLLNNKTIENVKFEEEGFITETFNEVIGEVDNLYQELMFYAGEE